MYTILYFSPTGNTKYLAGLLAEHLEVGEKKVIPLEFVNPQELEKDDHVILMFSIHGFNAPRTVKRFVKNIPEELYKHVHIIAVGCKTLWFNDGVSSDIRKILNSKKYDVKVDEVLAMPLTFLMSFPEESGKKAITESEHRIIEISALIKEITSSKKHITYKSKLINFIGKAEDPAARLFGLELHATKACDSCSICWNRCPENNIKPNKKNIPTFGFKCEMCMRCITKCPQKAITPYISKFMLIKNGYSLDNYLDKTKKRD
jgi:flavodoxin/Pyruvate/2-oxoacid:ferredoxin oxidoreductase delta subunit